MCSPGAAGSGWGASPVTAIDTDLGAAAVSAPASSAAARAVRSSAEGRTCGTRARGGAAALSKPYAPRLQAWETPAASAGPSILAAPSSPSSPSSPEQPQQPRAAHLVPGHQLLHLLQHLLLLLLEVERVWAAAQHQPLALEEACHRGLPWGQRGGGKVSGSGRCRQAALPAGCARRRAPRRRASRAARSWWPGRPGWSMARRAGAARLVSSWAGRCAGTRGGPARGWVRRSVSWGRCRCWCAWRRPPWSAHRGGWRQERGALLGVQRQLPREAAGGQHRCRAGRTASRQPAQPTWAVANKLVVAVDQLGR